MIRLQEYAEGEIVLNEGEHGKGFCILESGSLVVTREGKILSEIDQPGSIFGELSEILGMKRDAVINATTACKVRHVEESIEDIVTKNPKVAVKLIRTLGRRLYRMNRFATNEIISTETLPPASTVSTIKILVVDDKPNIVKQLTDIFAKNAWAVENTPDEAGALKICESTSFSAILISMALPGDTSVDLRRKLKTNHNVLNTPVIGMIVQGDEAAQKKALNSGFADCITKPFNANKTEAIMFKLMNLDSSARYFKFVDDYLLFKLPPELSPFVINDIKDNMDNRIRNTINEGILKLVIDVSALVEVGEEAMEVVGEFAEKIEDMKLPMRGTIIAIGEEAEMWNNLDGCEEWGICKDLESAKEHLDKDPEDEEEEEEE